MTVTWTCQDGLSGPVDATVSEVVSTEGSNQSATGTCEDLAGNTASDTHDGINIDETDPDPPSFVGGPADEGQLLLRLRPSGAHVLVQRRLVGSGRVCCQRLLEQASDPTR